MGLWSSQVTRQIEGLYPINNAFPAQISPPSASVAPAQDLHWAECQIALERADFSCGCIDNHPGAHTTNALKAFQASRHLPETGEWDQTTQQALAGPDPFTSYVITSDDADDVMVQPTTILEKSQAASLGYYSLEELLAEKFHVTHVFLHELNPHVTLDQGISIRVPNLSVPSTSPHHKITAASVRISLAAQSIEALDATGNTIAYFPCSIAADKLKRPVGNLTIVNYAPHPNYTFDPALFVEQAAKENIKRKLIFPPGPNNPVGEVWIGLSLPSYGIHGTPDPENIGKTFSHGCFRLTNWSALRLFHLVQIGLPVSIVP